MFEDIKERLESDSNSYTDSEIVTLFQDTTETLTQDCENCKHHAEIVAVSDFTNQVALKLDSMKGSNNFLSTALKDIEETIKLFKEVPDSLLTPIPRQVQNVSISNAIKDKMIRISKDTHTKKSFKAWVENFFWNWNKIQIF